MNFTPNSKRYEAMPYRRCGHSGILLPAISLGLWHNFGDIDNFENARNILRTAFDHGINHFDLANNYGPPSGTAESNFGKIFKEDFSNHRDELMISSKAGWPMWEGPYGDWGSKKHLFASIDQSLKRMGLDYVDIFYHHRPDPNTPLEETMGALDLIVRQGKALYIGISSYKAEEAKMAISILKKLGTPCLIHQPRYSMLDRWVENGLLKVLKEEGLGCIAFSPLEQGLLTNKYLKGIPNDSRAKSGRGNGAIEASQISEKKIMVANELNTIAVKRGQNLAQMALAWILKNPNITSVLVGASKPEQLLDSILCLSKMDFSEEEIRNIDIICQKI